MFNIQTPQGIFKLTPNNFQVQFEVDGGDILMHIIINKRKYKNRKRTTQRVTAKYNIEEEISLLEYAEIPLNIEHMTNLLNYINNENTSLIKETFLRAALEYPKTNIYWMLYALMNSYWCICGVIPIEYLPAANFITFHRFMEIDEETPKGDENV